MTGIIQLIGRVMMALIFILAGLGKIQDPTGTVGYMQSAGLPGILLWPTIALELLGGLLLLAVGGNTAFSIDNKRNSTDFFGTRQS
jgi:putative oxidoreductase